MNKQINFSLSVFLCLIFAGNLSAQFGSDIIESSEGDLEVTFLGHGSLLFEYDDLIIYVDPSGLQNTENLPKADLILVTHEHGDHFRPELIDALRNHSAVVITNERCAERVDGAIIMENGDTRTIRGLSIEAVPSYNLVHKNESGAFFHPKGRDNGYVISFGDTRIYCAGDSENHPEMKALKEIDVAFLPMNLPYTMTPEMVADAARNFRPSILYLYHYRNGDTETLEQLMENVEGVELRIREMYN